MGHRRSCRRRTRVATADRRLASQPPVIRPPPAHTVSLILHLVRHGETTANAAQLIAGWTDVPLTEKGVRQATRLAPLLQHDGYDAVWSSDLTRAAETARLAGFSPTLDARVRELHFGDLEGAPWQSVIEQYSAKFSDFASFAAPNGERVADMRDRILGFVDQLGTGRHAVFCHGGVIRVLLGELGEHRFVGNCAVIDLDWGARRILGERSARPALATDG